LYVFVIDGDVSINDQKLNKRDGFGVWNTDKVKVTADSDAEILLMEVPMN
jgi:redox-sensitive bicupin YhaK (pirin superfamily)